MIQDIAPSQYQVAYTPCEPSPANPVIWFSGKKICMKKSCEFFTCGEIMQAFPAAVLSYLFRIDDQPYFLLDMDDAGADLPELTVSPLNALRTMPTMTGSFAGYTAWHLCDFRRSNRFCGKCGHALIDGQDERKLICPDCGNTIYPRINPCIIVAVHDGDRLLMTKYAGRAVNWFVLIAGFMEIGESAEDTVRREVMEEAGVKVKNIRYFGSQPWGIPGNLTLGYTAELDGDDTITIDESELSEGRWFNREDVPAKDEQLSITQEMIRAFKAHQF